MFDIKQVQMKMDKTLELFRGNLGTIRAGRANPALLDSIMVSAYDSMVPLTTIASVSVLESRMLGVQVWDRENTKAVDKAIRSSNLGLNPQTEGTTLRIPIPPISEDRRRDLVKVAKEFTEQAKVAIRQVRKQELDRLKQLEKDKQIDQGLLNKGIKLVQEQTDSYIREIDLLMSKKEQELLSV